MYTLVKFVKSSLQFRAEPIISVASTQSSWVSYTRH